MRAGNIGIFAMPAADFTLVISYLENQITSL